MTLVWMKASGPDDRPVHVALGREVDHRVDVIFVEDRLDGRAVADVGLLEEVAFAPRAAPKRPRCRRGSRGCPRR